jgi:hypothetical protein
MSQILVKIKDSYENFMFEFHEPASVLVDKIAAKFNVPSSSIVLAELTGKPIDLTKELHTTSRPRMLMATF